MKLVSTAATTTAAPITATPITATATAIIFKYTFINIWITFPLIEKSVNILALCVYFHSAVPVFLHTPYLLVLQGIER